MPEPTLSPAASEIYRYGLYWISHPPYANNIASLDLQWVVDVPIPDEAADTVPDYVHV